MLFALVPKLVPDSNSGIKDFIISTKADRALYSGERKK